MYFSNKWIPFGSSKRDIWYKNITSERAHIRHMRMIRIIANGQVSKVFALNEVAQW